MEPDAPTPLASTPPPISAFDRVQTKPDAPPESGSAWRTIVFLLLVVVGLGVTYTFLRDGSGVANDNFLVHLIEASDTFQADLGTTRPDEAEDLVYNQLGWAISPPDLPGLALVGVQIAPVGQISSGTTNGAPTDVVVPAFRYEGASGESVVVYAYDYIVLDRVRSAFDLPEATYAVLGEPTPVDTRRVDDRYLVTWRRRAMIFTAVTTSEDAFERVGQAAAS